MDFLKKMNFTPMKALKAIGLVFLGVIVLAFGLSLVNASWRSFSMGMRNGGTMMAIAPQYAVDEISYKKSYDVSNSVSTLSVRNIAPERGTTGNNAESFEVTNYSASIETANVEETCSEVLVLKSKDYVIFEHSNMFDRGCNYTFKVEKDNVSEILSFIKNLDPKDISENIDTIKNQIDDFTSRTQILKKKLSAIDETLQSALSAYNEITVLATRAEDAGALAKIIDSKVGVIERMTNERLNISTELEYLARSKAEQMDRLDYTYFNVNVYENKFLDGENVKDSWKSAVRQFFENINRIAQSVTLGLVVLAFGAISVVVYLLLVVVVAKYVWRIIKWIWRK